MYYCCITNDVLGRQNNIIAYKNKLVFFYKDLLFVFQTASSAEYFEEYILTINFRHPKIL